MKCFAHISEEAVGVCGVCGKALCVNCSAYSGHSGVCPVCRLKEFEQEYARNKSSIIKTTLIAVAIAIAVIIITVISSLYYFLLGVLLSGILVLIMLPTIRRNRYLKGEIIKIRTFLYRGHAHI